MAKARAPSTTKPVASAQAPELLPLELVLEAGATDGVKAFFRGMPEPQRRRFAAHVVAWCRQVKTKDTIKTPRGEFSTRALFISSRAALMCAGSLTELCKVPRWDVPHGAEAYELLMDRRPEWLAQWANHLLAGERHWLDWLFVRQLVREGLVPRPDHPNYELGMIGGIACWQLGARPTVRQRLLEDPALLDDEVWHIFEHEGAGEISLSNVDRFHHDDWAHTLRDYAAAGRLSRSRLLACCIDALRRDYNHYRAKWFSAFYDLLEPTAAEDHDNAQAFLALLGVTAPNIVGWAFKKVQAQAKANSYRAEELVTGLRPALEARSKALVKSALKLLAKAAKDAPELTLDVATSSLVALEHPDSDAQAAALDVIEACAAVHGAPQLAEVIDLRRHAELVAASLRGRLTALLGEAPVASNRAKTPAAESAAAAPRHAEPTPALSALPQRLQRVFAIDALLEQPVLTPSGAEWMLPAARFDGSELPRLAGLEAIRPIAGLEELIDSAARVLEDAAGPDDVERVLDALARLADQRPEDFDRRTAPLLKRVEQLFQRDVVPFAGHGPAADVCGLLHAWITRNVTTFRTVKHETNKKIDILKVRLGKLELRSSTRNLPHILGSLSRRVHQLSLRVAQRQAHQLLSTPSHAGGFLDPRVLATRVNARRAAADSLAAPDTLDAAIAMLRCAPEHRAEALQILAASAGGGGSAPQASAPQASSEWYQAICYALGGDVTLKKYAENVSLWAAAARCRAPWSVDAQVAKAFPDVGPDVGEPARYEVSFHTDEHKNVCVVFSDAVKVRGFDLECIPVVMHTERGARMFDRQSLGNSSDAGIRWAATLWPTARESFFAAAFTQIAHNIDWWSPYWEAKTLLEPLLDPGTPLREMGVLLLAAGLGAKEPGEYGLATDAAINAINDGRLGSDNLGRALAVLLASGMIKPARWTKTLNDVARASDAHAGVIKLSLEACLPALAEPPRDYSKLLKLLHELCVQLDHGVVGPGRAQLEAVKGNNQVAKLSKAILAVPAVDSPALRLATRSLAAMRAEAARRWI